MVIRKNTTKFRANISGFYAFNGKGTVNTYTILLYLTIFPMLMAGEVLSL